jgi:hypothetical protein
MPLAGPGDPIRSCLSRRGGEAWARSALVRARAPTAGDSPWRGQASGAQRPAVPAPNRGTLAGTQAEVEGSLHDQHTLDGGIGVDSWASGGFVVSRCATARLSACYSRRSTQRRSLPAPAHRRSTYAPGPVAPAKEDQGAGSRARTRPTVGGNGCAVERRPLEATPRVPRGEDGARPPVN